MLTVPYLVCLIIAGFIVRPYGGEELMTPPEFTPYNEDFSVIPEIFLIPIGFNVSEVEVTDEVPLVPPGMEAEENEPHIKPVLLIAAIVVFLVVIALLIDKFYSRNDHQFEDYEETIEEVSASPFERQIKRKKLFNFGINYTIRRLFKRKVKEYMVTKGMYTQKSDTPKKLADTIKTWEDVNTLEQLYQKARYSGEAVERTELNMLYADRKKSKVILHKKFFD